MFAANLYGEGERAVVLALNFRGDGQSRMPGQKEVLSAPLRLNVLAAVHHLKKKRYETRGRGGRKHDAANASVAAEVGENDRLVLFAAMASDHPEQVLQGRGSDLALGTKFRWKTFGVTSTSTVQEFIPYERITWDALALLASKSTTARWACRRGHSLAINGQKKWHEVFIVAPEHKLGARLALQINACEFPSPAPSWREQKNAPFARLAAAEFVPRYLFRADCFVAM